MKSRILLALLCLSLNFKALPQTSNYAMLKISGMGDMTQVKIDAISRTSLFTHIGNVKMGTIDTVSFRYELTDKAQVYLKNADVKYSIEVIEMPPLPFEIEEVFPIRTYTNDDGYFTYEVIREVDKTKGDIFDLSNVWIAQAFNNADAVIDYSDRESGKIIGNGISYIYWDYQPKTRVEYQLEISIKEKRYRFQVYQMEFFPNNDLTYSYGAEGYIDDEGLRTGKERRRIGKRNLKEKMDNVVRRLIIDYHKKIQVENDDDW